MKLHTRDPPSKRKPSAEVRTLIQIERGFFRSYGADPFTAINVPILKQTHILLRRRWEGAAGGWRGWRKEGWHPPGPTSGEPCCPAGRNMQPSATGSFQVCREPRQSVPGDQVRQRHRGPATLARHGTTPSGAPHPVCAQGITVSALPIQLPCPRLLPPLPDASGIPSRHLGPHFPSRHLRLQRETG